MAERNMIRFDGLAKNRPFLLSLKVEKEDLDQLARELGAGSVTKVRFEGELTPRGRKGWELSGTLGATVIQECVVSGAPVTTRIDEPILRRYSDDIFEAYESGSENEMPEDDSLDELPEVLDLMDVVSEALSLNLPDYPRAPGAELPQTVFAQDGVKPMTDEDTKPFAGLAALRAQLEKKE